MEWIKIKRMEHVRENRLKWMELEGKDVKY